MAFLNFKSSKKTQKSPSFYDRENRIQNASDLRFFLNQNTEITTTVPITFRGIPLNDITLKQMENRLGNPLHVLNHEYRIAGHFVYFYKQKVEKLTLLMQLHFFNDFFLLAVTKFSSDYLLDNASKLKLTTQILQNYPGITQKTELHALKFKDQNGSLLFTEENVFYYIHYLCNSHQIQKFKTQINWENLTQTIPDTPIESVNKFI